MRNSGNLGYVRNNGNIFMRKALFYTQQCFVLLYNFGQQQHEMEIVSTLIKLKHHQTKTSQMKLAEIFMWSLLVYLMFLRQAVLSTVQLY